jgi:uncharacterized protein (UPF0179 family)
MKTKNIWWLILTIIICIVTGIFIWQLSSQKTKPVACTMEAKLCPDGSSVGRTGPNCEFTPCPVVDATKSWKIFTDAAQGVSFKYPESLLTTYMHPESWPPKVSVLNKTFTCKVGGTEITQAGITTKTIINGTEYCVTKESEGAAGSIYTTYTYAFAKTNKTIVLNLIIRSVQCDNYDDPQKTVCKNERASFDLDSIVDKIAQSTQLLYKDITPVACTMEAKLCPDGSYVGRTGPKCEFAPCP